MMCLIFSIYFICRYKEKNNDLQPYLRISVFSVFLFLVGQGIPNFFRFGYYFVPVLFVMFSEVLDRNIDKKYRKFLEAAIIVFLAAQYIVFKPGAGTDIYQFFWMV